MDLWQRLRWAGHEIDGRSSGLSAYRRQVSEALRERFDCSMASLWRLDGPAGGRVLTCVFSLSDDPLRNAAGESITEASMPEYLATLANDGLFRSDDVDTDARLQGILDSYLRPQRVRSLLDAAFRINGVTFGVLCLEHRDAVRHWSAADEADLRRAAQMISLALGRHLQPQGSLPPA